MAQKVDVDGAHASSQLRDDDLIHLISDHLKYLNQSVSVYLCV